MKINNYFKSVLWFMLSLIISVSNDSIAKYVSLNLPVSGIIFCRFLGSIITILPFIISRGIGSLYTSNLYIHVARGVLLFIGISIWIYGLSFIQISTATIISFSIPLFILLLSIFFLNERVIWQRWLVTILGFVGVMITMSPDLQNFTPSALLFLLSAFIFATLDIINKRFVVRESILGMLFYSALVTTILAAPSALYHWQTPTFVELLLLLILGGGANLILLCLLEAFALTDATALAPYRYLELIISSVVSYCIFAEVPPATTWYGAAILIPATLFIIYSEQTSEQIKQN